MEITVPERLAAGSIALRALDMKDVDAYVGGFVDDPELGALLGMDSDPDGSAVSDRISRSEEAVGRGQVEFAIVDATTDAFLGSMLLHSFDEANRRCEVGFWLNRSARGRGNGRRAVQLALDWAFESLDLLRVEMTTTPANHVVPALARSLGFAQEGILRSRNVERGQRVDIIFFGLLREEWESRGLT